MAQTYYNSVTTQPSQYTNNVYIAFWRNMENLNDLELVAKMTEGNLEAFKIIISRYQEKAFNLCFRITRNESDAEESVQDLFSTIFRKASSFKGDSQFSSWVYRIATNCALMKIRTRKRQTHGNVELNAFDISHAENNCDLVYQYERNDLKGKLTDAVNKLPAGYKEVFIMRDIDGIPSEAACELLDLSMTALKSRLHRARLMLRKLLKDTYKSYSGVDDKTLQDLLAA